MRHTTDMAGLVRVVGLSALAVVGLAGPAAALPSRGAGFVLPPPKPDEFRLASAEPAAPALPRFLSAIFSPPVPAVTPELAPASSDALASPFSTLFGGAPAQQRGALLPPLASRAEIDARIAHHARLNGVPAALVHRIVIRESKYNPRAVGRGGAMGLMQIKTGTARALGYSGDAAGLLDAETNLTYGVKYLAGAYRTADGNHDRAVGHYARGYYYAAKRKGLAGRSVREADATPAEPAPAPNPIRSLFSFASSDAPDRAGR